MAGVVGSSWDVYIAGALTGYDEEFLKVVKRQVYERVERICMQIGVTCYVPHKSPVHMRKNVPPREVYQSDNDAIVHAAVVVAYVGVPSIGVGMNIEIAHSKQLPVVLLHEEHSDVSSMVLGCPAVLKDDHITFPNSSPSAFETPLRLRLIRHMSARNLAQCRQQFGSDWPTEVWHQMQNMLDATFIAARPANRPITVDEWVRIANEWRSNDNGSVQHPLLS